MNIIKYVAFSALMIAANPECPGEITGYDCANPPKNTGVVKVKEKVDGYIIIVRASGVTGKSSSFIDSSARSLVSSYGVVGVTNSSTIGTKTYLSVDSISPLSMRSMDADPNVLIIQENAVVSIDSVGSWGIDRIDQRALPLDFAFNPVATGDKSHVYVIDTGVDVSHPSFVNKIGNGYFHPSVANSFEDQHGHGTHVAGTSSGLGFGVAQSSIIHPVRVLNAQGSGTTESVIAGIAFAVSDAQECGCESKSVINMSLGGDSQPALDQAVCDAVSAGVSVVVAAGNESTLACLKSPARASSAITVAASDIVDKAASFTNNGSCVDVWAPGVEIESAWPDSQSRVLSGTSMASPHVAGGVAICFEQGLSSDCVVSNATKDAIKSVGGAPNLLLFVGK